MKKFDEVLKRLSENEEAISDKDIEAAYRVHAYYQWEKAETSADIADTLMGYPARDDEAGWEKFNELRRRIESWISADNAKYEDVES
jgi:uncharacterized protein (DUF1684 family)